MYLSVFFSQFQMTATPQKDDTMVNFFYRAGPKVIKLFPCSTQLSKKFILLINVKMPTTVGILTFISMIKTSERLKARNFFICRHFSFYGQLKFRAQLSIKKVI